MKHCRNILSLQPIYTNHEFSVFRTKRGYIIVNSKKDFYNKKKQEYGHTHVKNKKTAIKIADFSYNKKMPHDLNPYLLSCLARITTDQKYKKEIENLLINKKNRRQKYANYF